MHSTHSFHSLRLMRRRRHCAQPSPFSGHQWWWSHATEMHAKRLVADASWVPKFCAILRSLLAGVAGYRSRVVYMFAH